MKAATLETALVGRAEDFLRDGQVRQARLMAEAALTHNPSDVQALTMMARVLIQYGEGAALRSVLEVLWPHISAENYGSRATAVLFYLRAKGNLDRLPGARTYLMRPCRTSVARERQSFFTARGELAHQEENYDLAWRSWTAANEAVYKPLDVEALKGDLHRSLSVSDAVLQACAHEYEGPPGPQMAFIMGMPRSGTTLAESILATQPGFVPAGEVGKKAEVVDLVTMGATLADMREAWELWRDRVVVPLADGVIGSPWPWNPRDNSGVKVYIDKMPGTVRVLPYLRTGFPRSPLVVMDRSPVDVVFSCYHNNFKSLYWSTSIEGILGMWDIQRRWITTWGPRLAEVGQPLYFVSYERLATDPGVREAMVRHVGSILGVDTDLEACHHPERAKRVVKTASSLQSGEIYAPRSSWEPYREWLPEEVFSLQRLIT